jgi:putative peptidoglycan binding protein
MAPQPVFPNSGKGSWYSQFHGRHHWRDKGDEPSSAALGVPDDVQGISFFNGETLGDWFLVQAPNGIISFEQQTDIGPHPDTGRVIDISAAAAERFGYSPDNFPTDAIWSWRAVGPPAAVAHLTPQQQAVAYRGMRGGTGEPVTIERPRLKKGARGDDVAELQALLGIKDDGYFGADTETAVKAFQTANSLVPDGIVGPATWAALEPKPKPIPPVIEPESPSESSLDNIEISLAEINARLGRIEETLATMPKKRKPKVKT